MSIEYDMSKFPHSGGVPCGVLLDRISISHQQKFTLLMRRHFKQMVLPTGRWSGTGDLLDL